MKKRLSGTKDLVHDAVGAVARLVEDTQDGVASQALALIGAVEPLRAPAEAIDAVRKLGTRLTVGSVQTINEAVRVALDACVATLPEDGPAAAAAQATVAEALLGAVNGVVGDHLRAQGNGLDLGMQLRFRERYFGLDDVSEALAGVPTAKLAVFVHGLAVTEAGWTIGAEAAWGDPKQTYATMLEAELGYTPIFVRYNSGLHISENGRALAAHLEALVRGAPEPVRELALIGHSMGGLLARSATHYAAPDAAWTSALRHVFTLGTPHLGSPLEKAGRLIEGALGSVATPATQVLAAVARQRSAAIRDLGDGLLVDEDWVGEDPADWLAKPRTEVAFLDDVTYVFIGATVTADPQSAGGKALGDLLVRLPSSTHEDVRCEHETFVLERHVLGGADHVALQNHPKVYALIRDELAKGQSRKSSRSR